MLKKIHPKGISFITIIAICFTLLAGCSKNDNQSEKSYHSPSISNDTQEFIYIAESISFPNHINGISNLAFFNDKVYFTALSYAVADEEYYNAKKQTPEIYSMNLDGSSLEKVSNYVAPASFQSEDIFGGTNIVDMIIDSSGNILVAEEWNLYQFDLPGNFDTEINDPYDFYLLKESGVVVRMLNNTGAELFTLDMSNLAEQTNNLHIRAMNIDKTGNVYIITESAGGVGKELSVFNNAGSLQFQLNVSNSREKLILLRGGSVAFPVEQQDSTGNGQHNLQLVDYNTKSLGETVSMPNVHGDIMQCDGSYDVILSETDNLYGYTIGSEGVILLNWLESGILRNGNNTISNIIMLPDERIICCREIRNGITDNSSYELIILTKSSRSELPQSKTLTLATYQRDGSLDKAVMEFNMTNQSYQIQLVDYADFNIGQDTNSGLMRLSTEIISGQIPDIIDVSSLPYTEYAAKGLLTDLYPYIDADIEYSRNDFIEGVFSASEIDGKLFQVFPAFSLSTVIGHPSIIGSDDSWSIDEFIDILKDNPEADMPLGHMMTGMFFLKTILSLDINDYIDWNAGTAYFDTSEFIQLLELCSTFNNNPDGYENVSVETAIPTGRQIMAWTPIHDFYNLQWYKSLFGGEVVYKGFPTNNGNGNFIVVDTGLAITEACQDKDAAWAFVRTLLNKDWQLNNSWGLPTNQAAFYEKVNIETTVNGYVNGESADAISMSEIDKILELINSCSFTGSRYIDDTIWNIISEETSNFFIGACNGEDAARVIQSRVSIMVSERS